MRIKLDESDRIFNRDSGDSVLQITDSVKFIAYFDSLDLFKQAYEKLT